MEGWIALGELRLPSASEWHRLHTVSRTWQSWAAGLCDLVFVTVGTFNASPCLGVPGQMKGLVSIKVSRRGGAAGPRWTAWSDSSRGDSREPQRRGQQDRDGPGDSSTHMKQEDSLHLNLPSLLLFIT